MMAGPPFFDERLDAWVLTRYRDVSAAFHEDCLIPVLPLSPRIETPPDAAENVAFRDQARRDLPASKVKCIEQPILDVCKRMVMALPVARPVDMIGEFAQPWCLEIAGILCDVGSAESENLASLAHRVFEASCDPYDHLLADAARDAVSKLAEYFRRKALLNMQMFIALTNSLPAFLGNAWVTLLENPDVLNRIQSDTTLIPGVVEELLRLCGPARSQFREAASRVRIAGCSIERGQRVVLMIESANIDPEQFEQPAEVRIGRTPGRHLAFGTGAHSCLGATLIRTAAVAATRTLLAYRRFSLPYEASQVTRFAMRYVGSLTVWLSPVAEMDSGVAPQYREAQIL